MYGLDSIVPKYKLSYFMGNPPFERYSNQNAEQKAEKHAVYIDKKCKAFKSAGNTDYVTAWYYKAVENMRGMGIRLSFVSTNSITQGEQVATLWNPLFEMFGICIDFAHRTFKWSSEVSEKSAVHCVIVGFISPKTATRAKAETPILFDEIRNIMGDNFVAVQKVSSERRRYKESSAEMHRASIWKG